MFPYRILYVGRNLTFLKFLSGNLRDCHVVRAPDDPLARSFIKSEINYSLLILDEDLPRTTTAELTRFVRSLAHRKQTPIVVFRESDDFNALVKTINDRLNAKH
jgi:DNA-binding response OmpR family regulator